MNKFAEPGDPEYSPPVQEAETPVSFYISRFFVGFTSLLVIKLTKFAI